MNMQTPDLSSFVLDVAAEQLAGRGWVVIENAFSHDLAAALAAEIDACAAADALDHAGIGRGDDRTIEGAIRQDRIRWLNGKSTAQQAYLDSMETVRRALNQRLFMGLFEFEATFAVYEPGGFYRRHLDSFRGAANRIVSTATYLNPDWTEGEGGQLILYEGDGRVAARIAPKARTLVLFLSECVPHEVAPVARRRLSIAGWYRVNASVAGVIDPPR